MSADEKVFGVLLRAYPREFRAAYGREMMLFFREQRRRDSSGVRFWMECGLDVVRSAPALRVESWQARWRRDIQSGEGIAMRMTMAILSILIGAIEAVNGLVEGRFAAASGLDAESLVAVTLVVIAGVLLLAAGVAQAVRSTRAPSLALAAAVTCIAVFAFLAVAIPRMSVFSTLLGIGFPIALLLFLRLGRSQPTRMIA